MPKPISELQVDGPILVIGGGPSVPSDLAQLAGIAFACVISANAHGFHQHRHRVDYIFVGDAIHSETREPMEPLMRTYGVPLIGYRDFVDYRVPPEARLLNSGQGAILAACLMGGRPVYPVGFDCWQGEATYFHDPDADVVCRRQGGRRIPQQLADLKAMTAGYDVRPVSGPLLTCYVASRPLDAAGGVS